MTERLRGRAGVAQRERRLQRTNYMCEDCMDAGLITLADVVDHTLPLSLGGSDTDENTRNLCSEHHRIRTAQQFGHKAHAPRLKRGTTGLDGWPTGGRS